jgi:hypothetical protein
MESSSVLLATDAWRSAFPGAVVGALVMQAVSNPELSVALEAENRRLEEQLRAAAGESSTTAPAQIGLRAFTSTTTAPAARPTGEGAAGVSRSSLS